MKLLVLTVLAVWLSIFAVATAQNPRMAVFDGLNELRAEAGVAPVEWNDTLADVAQARVSNMHRYKYIGHRHWDADLGEWVANDTVFKEFGWLTSHTEIALQCQRGSCNPEFVVILWAHSPGHLNAITSTRWTDVGVAKKAGRWVAAFGAR